MAYGRLIGAALCLLAAGCQRDPGFVGFWEVVAVSRDGVRQRDVGFFDFDGDGGVWVMSRYQFLGGGWVPDPQPEAVRLTCSVYDREDVVDGYRERGETYEVWIDGLGTDAALDVADYTARSIELQSGSAGWFASEGLGPLRVSLRR